MPGPRLTSVSAMQEQGEPGLRAGPQQLLLSLVGCGSSEAERSPLALIPHTVGLE